MVKYFFLLSSQVRSHFWLPRDGSPASQPGFTMYKFSTLCSKMENILAFHFNRMDLLPHKQVSQGIFHPFSQGMSFSR